MTIAECSIPSIKRIGRPDNTVFYGCIEEAEASRGPEILKFKRPLVESKTRLETRELLSICILVVTAA